MPGKEQVKSPKTRNSKEKNKQLLEHLVYNVICVEENDPMDKMLKCKTCTIRKPFDLLHMTYEEIKALKYPGGEDRKELIPLNIDECAKIRQLQKYINYLKQNSASNRVDYLSISEDDYDEFRSSNQGELLLPPTTSSTGTATASSTPAATKHKYTPAENWERGIKRDPNLFPTIKMDADWKDFSDKMLLEAKAQLVDDVLNLSYKPATTDEKDLFLLKKNYMMSVFKNHILTDKGKSIIATHTAAGEAQKVWKELVDYHKDSTQADNVCEMLLNYIVTSRIDDGTWTGGAHAYLLHWNKQVNEYNEKKTTGKILDEQKKIHLEAAVKGNPKLANVKTMSQLQGKLGTQINYQTYFDLLLEAAIQYDLAHQSSYQKRRVKRSVYQHEVEQQLNELPPDFQLPFAVNNHDSYNAQLHNFDTPVYELNQLRQTQRPLLPKDTWYSLSTDDRSAWNQLTDSGKQSIISDIPNKQQTNLIQNPNQYPSRMNHPSTCGNQASALQRATRKVKMHEFDSEDFAEFYKMYSAYQHVQENSIDNEGNNAIEANATQHYTTPSNDNEEPDLFNILQAKQQSNQQQITSKPTPGDVKRLLSSSTTKAHPFC